MLLIPARNRQAAAQDGGRHAAPVLALPASARAAALGDAYVGVGGDAAAVFYDPAQLATVGHAAALSVERYLASSLLGAFAASARAGRGAFAVGLQSLRADAIDETVGGELTGRTLTAGDAVVSVAYGAQLGALPALGAARVRAGVAAKYVRQRVAEASGGAAAADVALAVALGGGAVVSAVVRNVGGEVELLGVGSPLPRRAQLGVAVPTAARRGVSLLGTAVVTHAAREGARAAAGVEARWRPGGDGARGPGALALDLRVGVRQRTGDAALSPVTVGGGLGVGRLAVDYAFQAYSVLGSTQRLGVRWPR